MKIRTDFVTNSSSSSFIAFTINNSKLADLLEEYGLEINGDLDVSVDKDIVSAILNSVDNLDQLAVELENNTTATRLAYETMAAERLQDNSTYKKLDDLGKQVANTIAGRDLNINVADFLANDKDFQGVTHRVDWQNDSQAMDNILERFRQAMQDASIAWADNAVKGFGAEQFNFLIDGQLKTYTKQQVAETIAASQALKNLGSLNDYTGYNTPPNPFAYLSTLIM